MSNHREYQLGSQRLSLQLSSCGDRYSHQICLKQGQEWIAILSSVEGTADNTWPPSPPLQALDLNCENNRRQLALLMGMAGTSHWSASIALDGTHDVVHFEIACRSGERSSKLLTCSYQTAPHMQIKQVDKRKLLVWPPSNPGWQLFVETFIEHSPAYLNVDDSGFAVVAEDFDVLNTRRTARWAYAIGLQAARHCF